MERLEPLQLFFNTSHLQYDSNVELSKYIQTFLLNDHIYIYVYTRDKHTSYFQYDSNTISNISKNYFPLKPLHLHLYIFLKNE